MVNEVDDEPLEGYTREEVGVLEKGRALFDELSAEGLTYEEVSETTDPKVKVYCAPTKSASIFIGWGEIVAHADVAKCLAHQFSGCLAHQFSGTRVKAGAQRERGGGRLSIVNPVVNPIVKEVVKKLNDHSILYFTVRNLESRNSFSHVALVRGVRKIHEDGSAFVAYGDMSSADLDDKKDFAFDEDDVAVSVQAALKFEPLGSIGAVPQTKITAVVKIDFKGSVTAITKNKVAGKGTRYLSEFRSKFDRSFEIDAVRRSRIVQSIRGTQRVNADGFSNRFELRKGTVKVSSAFPMAKSFTKITGVGKAWGTSSMTIRAPLDETTAFFWDFQSRASSDFTGNIQRLVLQKRDEFNIVVQRIQTLESKHGGKHRNREFINDMTLHVVNEDRNVIVMEPVDAREGGSESAEHYTQDSTQQAKERIIVRFTRIGDKVTLVDFVSEIDLGLFVSSKATRAFVEKRLDELAIVNRFFTYQAKQEDVTAKDGEALGHYLFWAGRLLPVQNSRSKRREKVRELLNKSKAMNAVKQKYPWISILIEKAREGAFAANKPIATSLSCLTEEEALVIGKNMMPALKSRKLAAAGIAQWRGQNGAMNELFSEFPFLEDFFIALAQGVINAAPWGLIWR